MRCPLVLSALALAVLAWPTAAFERLEITPGDRVLVSVTDVTPVHEFTLRLPRDGQLRVSAKRARKSKALPSRGLLDEGYEPVELIPFSRSGARSVPLPRSGTYRFVLTGADDTRGDLVATTKLKPLKKAKLKVRGKDEERPTELVFGALVDHELSYKLKWKGPAPVSVARVVGPDDDVLVPTEAPRVKKRSAKGRGYQTTRFGDHRFELDVPEGTERWSLVVKIKGRGTTGITRDLRVEGDPSPEPLELDLIGTRLERNGPDVALPKITVVDEVGGPNELILLIAALQSGETSPFGMEPPGCGTLFPGGEGPPESYSVECGDTHAATIGSIVRNGEEQITAFVADIETPVGSGQTALSEIEYGESGAPTSWTEVRTFDVSGNVHRLVVSDATLYPNGAFTYRVEHTDPSGVTRTLDFIPFN